MAWMRAMRKRWAPKTVHGDGPEQLCRWWCHLLRWETPEKRRFRRETGEFSNRSKLRPIKFVMLIKYRGGAVRWAVLPISQDF